MSELENLIQKIETKFKLLSLARKETARTLQRNKKKELEKQINVIESRIDEIRDLKAEVQEKKIETGESSEQVEQWSTDIETRLETHDPQIEELQTKLLLITKQSEDEVREKEYQQEQRILSLRYAEEKKIEKMKAEIKTNEDRINEREQIRDNTTKVKLPKLVITKFEGTHLDWLRFWSQFETEIDKSNISSVGKFSYLKELLNPKIRTLIDGLPFTTEGYERAKNILTTKFGKQSEVANAHIQSIMNLPSIHHYHPEKIHEFYETTRIQALETMGN